MKSLKTTPLSSDTVKTPVGKLTLIASDDQLHAILWEKEKPNRVRMTAQSVKKPHPLLEEVKNQLTEYFEGKRKTFDLPFHFEGTEFQKRVWNALCTIPFGKTLSYGELAEQIGSPQASRAVGAANGRNPLSIVVPCHRVIGKNGQLTGFAGGVQVKAKLLEHENNAVESNHR